MTDEVESSSAGGVPLAKVGCAAIAVFGLIQIYAGWLGLADSFGTGWAVGGLIALFLFRFSLPFTIGAFLCGRNIWAWHWTLALLFAAPGLAFAMPGVIAKLIERVKR